MAWLNIAVLQSQGRDGVLVDEVSYCANGEVFFPRVLVELVLVGSVTDVGNHFVDVVGRDEGTCSSARWGLRSPR